MTKRDAQIDRSDASLPDAIGIAIALIDPLGAALAIGDACNASDLELDSALGGEANHLTQEVGAPAFLQKRA
jgi:hypothetical protein